MKRIRKIKGRHIISATALVGIAFAALNFSGFSQQSSGLEDFVLFAEEKVMLENEVQVSSGDLGSNNKIDIQKENIVNGNLFADKVTIDKNTVINGNVSFNNLQFKKGVQILGSTTTPISLPVGELPDVPDFQAGNQDFRFQEEDNTLSSGNYRNITLEKDSTLILAGGTYNIARLFLKENSTIIFETPTILNIKQEFKAQQKISILPGENAAFNDLHINYKDKKPIQFGKNSFLNFKLLAPDVDVRIGEATTLRGQILAKKIKVEKNSVLSKQELVVKESNPIKIVGDQEGNRFFVNEFIILFTDEAMESEIRQFAEVVNAVATGIIPTPPIYKFEVNINAAEDLDDILEQIRNLNNPIVVEISKNFIGIR